MNFSTFCSNINLIYGKSMWITAIFSVEWYVNQNGVSHVHPNEDHGVQIYSGPFLDIMA